MYQPPTDSLYKFMAITGVIIALFTIYIAENFLNEAETSLYEMNSKISISKAELDYFDEQAKSLESIIDNSILRQQGKYKLDKNKLEITYSNEEIKSLTAELYKNARDRKILLANLILAKDRQSQLVKNLKDMHSIMIFIGLYGCITAWAGFIFWYIKIQVYEDRILRTSSESVTKNNIRVRMRNKKRCKRSHYFKYFFLVLFPGISAHHNNKPPYYLSIPVHPVNQSKFWSCERACVHHQSQ